MVVDTDGVTKMVDKDSLTKIVGGVCGEEEAGGGRRSGRRSTRDTESKTRTPHKVVGKNIVLQAPAIPGIASAKNPFCPAQNCHARKSFKVWTRLDSMSLIVSHYLILAMANLL